MTEFHEIDSLVELAENIQDDLRYEADRGGESQEFQELLLEAESYILKAIPVMKAASALLPKYDNEPIPSPKEDKGITIRKSWNDIRPLVTAEFLTTLQEAAKVYGHSGDWPAVRNFVRECYYEATGVSPTGDFYTPYEN